MTVMRDRSQNAEFQEGATDGTWKKIPPDRSNVEVSLDERREMSWRYGFEDDPTKYLANGQTARRNSRDHG